MKKLKSKDELTNDLEKGHYKAALRYFLRENSISVKKAKITEMIDNYDVVMGSLKDSAVEVLGKRLAEKGLEQLNQMTKERYTDIIDLAYRDHESNGNVGGNSGASSGGWRRA